MRRLQSTNEEMVTSKEELQSLNEELTTLNYELQSKNEELSEINNDMKNLLNSTQVPTLFLDNNLKIKRFTPYVTKIISLIPERHRASDHRHRLQPAVRWSGQRCK